jgi:hypothetical protein
VIRALALLSALLALAAPGVGATQAPATSEAPPAVGGPLGLVLTADLGGGGSLGGGSDYTPKGLFEGEVGAGYELPLGFRPELSLALGLAPNVHIALRPGLHYTLADLPFYVRGALDWSTVRGTGSWRWLLAGGGAEVRLTDVLGGFAEADVGLPLARGVGLGVLVRAGVSFRL